ncbi:MAG: RNA polymerase-binding protein DksA [Nitrospiraceae bacterium]|nr:MAG: RNA polymerase-binding protein DksA [Nitrospiraceae bacterium]
MTKKKTTRSTVKPKKKKVQVKKAVKAKKKIKKKQVKRKSAKPKAKKSTKKTLSQREKKLLKIKESLIEQREGLLKEAELALNTLPGEINFPDMGDQATAEADRDFMLRLRDRERMLLKKIEDTLDRIEDGTFGICENCGSEIGVKRLEARPVTTYCIDCKTRQEEEERIAEGG